MVQQQKQQPQHDQQSWSPTSPLLFRIKKSLSDDEHEDIEQAIIKIMNDVDMKDCSNSITRHNDKQQPKHQRELSESSLSHMSNFAYYEINSNNNSNNNSYNDDDDDIRTSCTSTNDTFTDFYGDEEYDSSTDVEENEKDSLLLSLREQQDEGMSLSRRGNRRRYSDKKSIHNTKTIEKNNNSIAMLAFGALGIYISHLMYGNVQEVLFLYRSSINGTGFTYVWLLQAMESTASIVLGCIGSLYYTNRTNQQQLNNSKHITNNQRTKQQKQQQKRQQNKNHPSRNNNLLQQTKTIQEMNNNNDRVLVGEKTIITKELPIQMLFFVGMSQVLSRGMTSLALASGVSFPVCTLAKSAKIVPVMFGQLILGGSHYTIRDYLFCLFIVSGVTLVSIGEQKQPSVKNGIGNVDEGYNTQSTDFFGILCLMLSLLFDGCTAGLQKRMKRDTTKQVPNMYDFLLYSHMSMWLIALFMSIVVTGEFMDGIQYILTEPVMVRNMLIQVCITSVIGQAFVFYVIEKFDTYVCTTITTTRKFLSVLLSIIIQGHVSLTQTGYIGLILAIIAMMIEIESKWSLIHPTKETKNTTTKNNKAITII